MYQHRACTNTEHAPIQQCEELPQWTPGGIHRLLCCRKIVSTNHLAVEEQIRVQGFISVSCLAPGRDNTCNNTHLKICWHSKEWASYCHECIFKSTDVHGVYNEGRHWTKRLWFYLSDFLVWMSHWKRHLVASWIHNIPRSSSSACLAVTETRFTFNF